MPKQKPATACRQSSTRETKAQRTYRLTARRAEQRARTIASTVLNDYDPTKNAPRVSKRKYQQHGRGKLGHQRNPRSADARAEAAAPFRADLERIAALGIDPKYLNANGAACRDEKALSRKVASLAWRKEAKAWDNARKSKALTGVAVLGRAAA